MSFGKEIKGLREYVTLSLIPLFDKERRKEVMNSDKKIFNEETNRQSAEILIEGLISSTQLLEKQISQCFIVLYYFFCSCFDGQRCTKRIKIRL